MPADAARTGAEAEKRLAASRAVELVRDGMVVGLGTGSTASEAIRLLGDRVRDGLKIRGIPTSEVTRKLARECGVPMAGLADVPRVDITIDGADEIDPQMRLIKGGGGALLREKIVASASAMLVIIADATKVVRQLGAFPLPVEVVPFALPVVRRAVEKLGAKPVLRGGDSTPYVTVDGHFILDCAFKRIDDPDALAADIGTVPGVVENGLFIGMADMVIIGRGDQVKIFKRAKA
ncbi:MAG: ribose-5-phosphate isomerase RpiA [Alphaproteobacteria bacterium]